MVKGVRIRYWIYTIEEAILKDDHLDVDLDKVSLTSRVSKISKSNKVNVD